jgi:hypothetical protein
MASSSFQVEKKKKTIEKKKNAEKRSSFPSSSRSTLSPLALASALPLMPFCFKRFFMASFFQTKKKKRKETKKKP